MERIQLVYILPNLMFMLAAFLRFLIIRDVGETNLRLQQSQSYTYLCMALLILLTNLQAGHETSQMSIAIEVPFMILQSLTFIAVVCLTRMHQVRNMPQPSYCVPLFVYFSLFVRLSVVLVYPNLATPFELSMIVVFAFMAII